MRLGEAVRLRLDEVDLRQAVLTVQHSKGRSRLLAIRTDLVAELRQYLQRREAALIACGQTDPGTLFIRRDGSALTLPAASQGLRALLRELGLKPPVNALQEPLLFDRVVAVLKRSAWAIEGVDVHAKLPWLSAYLGHLNLLGTEVYLKATPQLLELASQRFEQRARGKRQPP